MQVSDRDILEISLQDRKKGVRLLFERYYRPLVLYAGTLIRDDFTAEDVVQDLFVRLLEGDYLEKIDPLALRSYLYSSVRNSCYSHENKKDVLKLAIDYTRMEIAEETLASLNQQIVDDVTKEINRLPAQTHRVLEGVLMQDMEYRKIAEELHISVNTVKTLLKNGMRVLREKFREENAWFGNFFSRLIHPSPPFFSLILKHRTKRDGNTRIDRGYYREDAPGQGERF
ncbi:MAG: sigma-70 family RNA polymerase sigma factor [Odoribacteraceae bacterium]|jgi:RNA polymerase sigma-70 factor (ECF subfamily)|nr:sigma-70 family RNA polymerase sigma factor [Odoribacteraceae bacterium]